MPGKTSQDYPLRIDAVPAGQNGGLIGMTFCPGKKQAVALDGPWDRDLDTDIQALKAFDCTALVTLMEAWELEDVEVPAPLLENKLEQAGIEWYLLPIRDSGVPDVRFESKWAYAGLCLRKHLRAGCHIVVHCKGGLGRTGVIAARLLIEFGVSPDEAINAVRQARPGTIENANQKAFVQICRAVSAGETDISLQERRLACLLGGAVGDAFGYAVEFKKWPQIRHEHGETGLREPVRQFGRLLVSDDTQMTLFTLEGLLRGLARASDPGVETLVAEIRTAYLDWLFTQEGPAPGHEPVGSLWKEPVLNVQRAPGVTCLTALRAGGEGAPINIINDSKGCGGVMRVAPIGLFPDMLDADQAFELGVRASALTHTHASGYLAAGMMAAIIRLLVDGHSFLDAIGEATELLSGNDGKTETDRAIAKALELSGANLESVDAVTRLGQGWVAEEALAIGIYAALQGRDFPEVLAIAANHDGDSDSTASIAGQLYGAWRGLATLPHE